MIPQRYIHIHDFMMHLQLGHTELTITVDHPTISKQISPLCNPSCIWLDNMAEHES